MRYRILFFLFLSLFSFRSFAQPAKNNDGLKQPRVLILLDASSSMLNDWNSSLSRFQGAASVINALMDSMYTVNSAVEFGLRVYGQDFPAGENNCFDTRNEVMFSKDNRTQMSLRLESLHPRGVSPIAYALKQAAHEDLVDEVRNAYAIILISDGGESCGGNICDVVQTLLQHKIFFRPYIISLVDYAPLRAQYACLGTYLQVVQKSDIGPAINTILTDYRPMLVLPTIRTAPPVVSAPHPPAPVKPETTLVQIPKWIPARAELSFIAIPVRISNMPVHYATPAPARIHVASVVVKKDSVIKPPPPIVKKDTIVKPPTPVVKKDTIPVPPVVHVPPPPVKKDTTIVRIVKVDPPTNVVVPPRPTVPADQPLEVDATIDRIDASETLIAVYFTDGKGKYFSSTPKMQVVDPKTGKVIKDFYRTVDANGEPDPQKVTAGSYRLVSVGKRSTKTRDIEIMPNKLNRIIIKVTVGSLKFTYAGAPNRPVSEYDAIVNRRFEPGPVVHQKASVELEYPPGNYYIELNTLPISRYNTDIDFGNETEILVPQPGFLQIINNTAVGSVHLFHPLGDQYVKFYTMNVTGDVNAQKVQMKPGTYEARWLLNARTPGAREKVQRFEVKSNSITQIELQN